MFPVHVGLRIHRPYRRTGPPAVNRKSKNQVNEITQNNADCAPESDGGTNGGHD